MFLDQPYCIKRFFVGTKKQKIWEPSNRLLGPVDVCASSLMRLLLESLAPILSRNLTHSHAITIEITLRRLEPD